MDFFAGLSRRRRTGAGLPGAEFASTIPRFDPRTLTTATGRLAPAIMATPFFDNWLASRRSLVLVTTIASCRRP
jgi:hypothetical protein